MEKNLEAVRLEYRKNLAWFFCMDDYSVLEKASDEEKRRIVAHARKVRKIKSIPAPGPAHGGNPYIMLQRKINNKGKIIK